MFENSNLLQVIFAIFTRLESCGTELFYKVLQNGKWIHILIFLNKKNPLSCFLAFSKLVLVWYKPTHIIIFTRFCNDLWALEFWISNIKTQYKNYLFVLVFTLQLHRIFRCSSSNSIAMYFLSFFFLLFFFFYLVFFVQKIAPVEFCFRGGW